MGFPDTSMEYGYGIWRPINPWILPGSGIPDPGFGSQYTVAEIRISCNGHRILAEVEFSTMKA
jgi:hypothetical protein